MATTTDRPPTRRSVLAGGLAVAVCLACCLLPVAAAGGLLAGLVERRCRSDPARRRAGVGRSRGGRGVVVATHPIHSRDLSVRLRR
jgi:hypothetical protein